MNRPRIKVRCIAFSSNVFRKKLRVKIKPRTNSAQLSSRDLVEHKAF